MSATRQPRAAIVDVSRSRNHGDRRWVLGPLVAAFLLPACVPTTRALDGLACDDDDGCLPGFVCVERVCEGVDRSGEGEGQGGEGEGGEGEGGEGEGGEGEGEGGEGEGGEGEGGEGEGGEGGGGEGEGEGEGGEGEGEQFPCGPPAGDADGDGHTNQAECAFPETNRGIPAYLDECVPEPGQFGSRDSDGDGLDDIREGRCLPTPLNSDGDGLLDHLDRDDDDDGIPTDVEFNACLVVVERAPKVFSTPACDFERIRDQLPAWRDPDSDGDGIRDGTTEASDRLGVDSDGDGFFNWGDQDDADGCVPQTGGPC